MSSRPPVVPKGLKACLEDIVTGARPDGTLIVVCEGEADAMPLADALEGYAQRVFAGLTRGRSIVVHRADPSGFWGEDRRRFEDGCFHRSRITSEPAHLYLTTEPFHTIPSIRDRVTWVDRKGKPVA